LTLNCLRLTARITLAIQDSLLVTWLSSYQTGFPPAKLHDLCSVATETADTIYNAHIT